MKKYKLTWGLIQYLVFSEDKEPWDSCTDAQIRRTLKKEQIL